MKISVAVFIFLLFVAPAIAMTPEEKLKDPVLEARARMISQEVRCVVCQNQSIDDSDALLARDLRLIVREQITAGKSNKEVKDYLVRRYGSFVLLKPPFNKATLFLWFGPALLAFLSGWAVLRYVRAHQIKPQDELSVEDKRRAADLLDRL
jgi:cytochrome c-type biogenesis protein CcmH